MPKTKEKELTVAVVEKELNPMLKKAQSMKITNAKEMEIATEELSQLNIAKDKVTERMETITLPAKESIKAAEAIWKPFIKSAKEAIDTIRTKMGEYHLAETMRAREEERKIADKIKPGKGNLSFEKGAEKIANIEKPETRVEAASGKVSFREETDFEVMDVTMLPIEYMLANEVKIRADMKLGKPNIPGVRYFTKMVPVNNRK